MNIGNNNYDDPETQSPNQNHQSSLGNLAPNVNPSGSGSSIMEAPLLQEQRQSLWQQTDGNGLPHVQVPQKQVYDFRKHTNNYKMIEKNDALASGKPLSLEQLSLFGPDPVQFEYELRSDSNFSESDVPRIARELAHKKKKQEQQRKEEERLAAERAAQPEENVRAPDAAVAEQLVGPAAGQGRRRGRGNNPLNADGMEIPPPMQNYQERPILGGFVYLRQCDRCDLFWGYFKDVERDFIYSNMFIMGLTLLVLLILSFQASGETYYGNI